MAHNRLVASETPGSIKAMEYLEEIVKKSGHIADDPGLRDTFAELPRAPIRIICCALDKGINHGNMLRIAECFRLEEVCFSPVSRRKEKDFSGGFAALHWQPHRWVEPIEAVKEARAAGYRIYCMHLAEDAKPLRSVDWSHPAALVFGQEWYGVDADVAELCHESIAIPLYGVIQSLNVAVTAALAVESCFEAYRAKQPDFEPARAVSKAVLENG